MESGYRSGTAAGGGGVVEAAGGGLLCHACGYQYPNAHPSAKQRRAHRKNCGKPPSSAAAGAGEEGEGAGERDGKGLFQGEGSGGGIAAGAAECGGGLPGSAPEAGDAAEDGDNAEHSSRDGTVVRSSVDGCAEVTPEASKSDNDDTLAKVSTQYSEKGLPLLDENPSDPAFGSEQLQDVYTSFVPAQPEDGFARSSSAFSVQEIEDSSVVSQAANATADGISEQTDDAVSQPIGTAVTEVDDMTNTIGKHIPSEDKSIIGGEYDFSLQETLQTKTREGHSTTSVEEDPSDKNLSVVDSDEFSNNNTKCDQRNTDDLGDYRSQESDNVRIQQQLDITSVTADHVAIPKQVDIVEEQDYANTAGGIQAISSASGPAVAAEVVSVGDVDSIAMNVCSSDITMEDSILKNVTSGTVVPSQVDLVELSTSGTTHEVNMISSTNDVEEMRQNEEIAANLATPEINEVHIRGNLEEKQQNKEIMADSVSHETNVACSTDNSCNISAAQSAGSVKEKEQIDQVIADLGSEKLNVKSRRDIFEEIKQSAVDAKANHDIDVACGIETIEGKNAACEINAGNATDNVEDKKQGEEITTGPISHGINMMCSTVNEESMHTEGIAEHPSSHETIVVHSTDNVEETKYEETMADPTSHIIGVVSGGVEDRQEEETALDPTSDGINVAPSTDNLEKNKTEGPISDTTTCRSYAESTTDVEEKQQDKETTADPGSGGNSTTQSTADASKGMKNGDATTDPVPDEINVAQSTDDAGERGQKEESAAKEITTIQSADDPKAIDQSEEIADKEMVTDSERNHVSLKHLLADKSAETKEKKASTKDRVLSFKRRASKDNVSPVKPGSPKAGSGQQDWNSPARLPTEKKPKGRKQQWVPFICCPSIH